MVSEVMATASGSGNSKDQGDELATQRLLRELSRCVSIDLEVSKDSGRIHAFAGVRGDGGNVKYPSASAGFHRALADLDNLADGADFALGHNFINFDLVHLRAANPNLRLLTLPVIDTLWLNPLAFPRNPYHSLVKHYQDGQLLTGRKNDPKQDARIALEVFADQQASLKEAPPNLLAAWHWLTTQQSDIAQQPYSAQQPHSGFDLFFKCLRDAAKPSSGEAREAIHSCTNGLSCQTHARKAIFMAEDHGWALAFALAWLSVAGSNSVMPPWVRHQFPEAGKLVRRLRDLKCDDQQCSWCQERHNAQRELKRFFGLNKFRSEPATKTGYSLQQAIVEAAMAGEHILGILPTGAGKSLCYQIPALSRYEKTGAVTVVISPLVALMADQVAGLEARGITSCSTINGMLSMPERADALEKLRLGDTAIVLISPEQLRSISFRRALEQREIGAWVLDEAHCLSKWGHDFRPDYLYVGRYIRERAENGLTPPLLCLTATAKPGVKDEIVEYFAKQLNIEIRVFDGGSERTNLEFVVVETSNSMKLYDIHMILTEHLPPDKEGGAIVYCATRQKTEDVANFLVEQGYSADRFHAGLQPEEKKAIQRNFINGDLKAIAATNAFGMGIDKPDVRLVIHGDIPSSLENYLQEAGRAGRDQQQAHCVLLYTKDDVERQFGMSARSRLTRREIHAVLMALRRLARRNKSDEVVATVGEILLKDDDNDFQRDSATDDTRGRTALAWLEESDLLSREENRVRIFPSSLRVNTVEEARAKLEARQVNDQTRERLLTIVRLLISADRDEGISTDLLMETTGLNPEQVRAALYDLEKCGIAQNDTVLTAFVHVGVSNHSKKRFEQAAEAEVELLSLMQEMAPDMAPGDQAPLNRRVASQRIKDAGIDHVRPEHISRLLRGIAQDGRGEGIGGGSITLRKADADSDWVTLRRDWNLLVKIAQRRRAGASRLLDHLVSCAPKGRTGRDLLAETTLGELTKAVESDLTLKTEDIKDYRRLVDRSLVWLHEQEVIRLNKGLTVFRPAMTIHLAGERRGYRNTDFESLKIHYDETVRQIHVMAEYAQRGLTNMAEALRLSLDYFALGDTEFLRRWLPNRGSELSRQTTPESWRKIVESLNNPAQRQLVADTRENTNVLVLAGPGSGKTRVLVHRIAYLIRVRRENPRGILALAYNRHAAVEIRRRLAELVGDDSRGVLILTCHGMAMRLVGTSFSVRAKRAERPDNKQFQDVLQEATALLLGDGLEFDEAEETRTRLLAGFRWILVDEYQDVGQDEYDLISALSGRTHFDDDSKLTMFAVGDDDQNIYSFKGSSVKFIHSFEADYQAKPAYLIDNYRSTRHIIAASNVVIKPANARMKVDQQIRINKRRSNEPAGGDWEVRDPVGRGRIQLLHGGVDAITQAQAAMYELRRLQTLDPAWDWSRCAVLAKEWKYLEPVRSICELESIPVQMANEDFPSIWHLRETQCLLAWLDKRDSRLIRNTELHSWHRQQPQSPWRELLQEAIEAHELEAVSAEVPTDTFIEWLAEWAREARKRQRGLLLSTAHRGKGLEFDHVIVLDGGWHRSAPEEDPDASRRLYYVSMTRARHTLGLSYIGDPNPFQKSLRDNPAVVWREPVESPPPEPELARRYRQLSLGDVYLSFAGNKPPDHRMHQALADLSPGDELTVQQQSEPWELLDQKGIVVGRLAAGFQPPDKMVCTSASVWAIATWKRSYSDAEYQEQLKCDTWEVVLPELIFEPSDRQ